MQKRTHEPTDASDSFVLWILVRLWQKVQVIEQGIIKIMAWQDEVIAVMTEVDEKLDKAYEEIIARIAELETLLQNANVVTPEVQAKLDELRADAQKLDDVVPDPLPEPSP